MLQLLPYCILSLYLYNIAEEELLDIRPFIRKMTLNM